MLLPVFAFGKHFMKMSKIQDKAFYDLPMSLLSVTLKVSNVFSSVVTDITRILWACLSCLFKAFLLLYYLPQVSQEISSYDDDKPGYHLREYSSFEKRLYICRHIVRSGTFLLFNTCDSGVEWAFKLPPLSFDCDKTRTSSPTEHAKTVDVLQQ